MIDPNPHISRYSALSVISPHAIVPRLVRSGLPAALGLTVAAFLSAGIAKADPVDCSAASKPAEFEICNSETLMVNDETLSRIQGEIESRATSRPQRQLIQRSHEAWLRERDSCGADRPCLELRYEARIAELKRGDALRPVASNGFIRFGQRGTSG
ncbi:MAG: hypothetical protein R3D32_09560 [Nitratireductor sp.]